MSSTKTRGDVLKTYSVRVVDNTYNPIDVINAVSMDIGNENVRGCVKCNGQWIITMKTKEDAELLQETGLKIGKDSCTVTGVSKNIITVSCFGVPSYVEDHELSGKLTDFGCLIKSQWTHKYYTEFPGVENGIRFVRVELPPNARSLPYAINIDGEHIRIKHNGQTKVCNKCLSDSHIMRDCPQYTCRECGSQGHAESRCPQVKCFRCNSYGHKSFLCQTESPQTISVDPPMKSSPQSKPVPPTEQETSAPSVPVSMDTTPETPEKTTKPAELSAGTNEETTKNKSSNKAKDDQKSDKSGTKRSMSSDEDAMLEIMVKQKIQALARRRSISPNLRLTRNYTPKKS